jgi:hypothetical protein
VRADLIRVHTRPARKGDALLVFETDVARVAKVLETTPRGRGCRQRLKTALLAAS